MSEDATGLPKDAFRVPPLCRRHAHELIVRRLQIPESGPWEMTTVACNLLLFGPTMRDPRLTAIASDDLQGMRVLVQGLKCLACFLPAEYFRAATEVLRGGFVHGFAVAYGKETDPAWPYPVPPAPPADAT